MNSALSHNTDAENHQTEDISHPPVHFLSSARVTKPEGLLLCTRDPATVWKKLLVYDYLHSRKRHSFRCSCFFKSPISVKKNPVHSEP
jgi:hypothetical protein